MISKSYAGRLLSSEKQTLSQLIAKTPKLPQSGRLYPKYSVTAVDTKQASTEGAVI